MLQEDLLEWKLLSESTCPESKTDMQRLWSRDTSVDGTKLAATEQMFRVQLLIADIQPEIAFNCFVNPDLRQKWDARMQEVKRFQTDEGKECLYFTVRSNTCLVQDRDCLTEVQQKANYPNEGEFTFAFKST